MPMDASSNQNGSKRNLEEAEASEPPNKRSSPIENVAPTIQNTSTMEETDTLPTIRRLKLEAIFHPKFENENRNNQDIRSQMKKLVSMEKGYLEVSLKHSGSLLLWSGGQRFYSKNATDNQFTHVGEIVLRQHFYRAWFDEADSKDFEKKYRECSEFVEKNRLTLSFELVTDVLGHHGAIPHKDFLILTAVASRSEERFVSTLELVRLAHQFRLPHNDYWVFSTDTDPLFHQYDSTRETGMARDTIQSLTQSADAHICSLYPHELFQGDILEGVVIRYVPYRQKETTAEQRSLLEDVAAVSKDILCSVPPDRPMSYELAMGKINSPVLTTNVRQVFHRCMKGRQHSRDGGSGTPREEFGYAMQNILSQSDHHNRRHVERLDVSKRQGKSSLPTIVNDLVNSNADIDEETRRITKLIQTLERLKDRVDYKVMRENSGGKHRWLCIVHIFWDHTFQKFYKRMDNGDMVLYRGCCLELDANGPSEYGRDEELPQYRDDTNENDDTLMLKMKFLPYMVRTFACRNGLKVLKNGGTEAFEEFTVNLMTKWGISEQSIAKWQPFFRAWASYAYPFLDGQSPPVESFLPLDGTFYLEYLEQFTKLYQSERPTEEASRKTKLGEPFRGAVFVVGLEKDSASSFASFAATELGVSRRRDNIKSVKSLDLIASRSPQHGGLVCSATVEDGVKNVRQHLKTFHDSMSILMVNCSDSHIESLEASGKDCTGLAGKRNSWKNCRCSVYEVSFSNLSDSDLSQNGEVQKVIEQLWIRATAIPRPDLRPGLLVFFPGIPGCGKSTLCNAEAQSKVVRFVKELGESDSSSGSNENVRNVIFLEGDNCKKKYWPAVKEQRGLDPSSIFVADKNVPPATWQTIGTVCAQTRGVGLPVIPDKAALTTTSVTGSYGKDGKYNNGFVHHYPFSLHFVAVCLRRVLARPSGSHSGRLDSSTPTACLIVMKFVGLYRNVTADQFVKELRRRAEGAGAYSLMAPIEVPFLAEKKLPELPSDLVEVLLKALRHQTNWDNANMDVDEKAAMQDVETELRHMLKKYDDFLEGLTADEIDSRESFLSQLEDRIKMLDSSNPSSIIAATNFVKIVSLDLGLDAVQEALMTCTKQSTSVLCFLKDITGGKEDETLDNKALDGSEFVKNSHVTMVHNSEISQTDMHERYDGVRNRGVNVTLHELLWSDRVAAFSVTVDSVTNDEKKAAVPKPHNSFSHVTVWYRKGESAVLANELPRMLEEGKAKRFELNEPIVLKGVVSYWTDEMTSKR